MRLNNLPQLQQSHNFTSHLTATAVHLNPPSATTPSAVAQPVVTPMDQYSNNNHSMIPGDVHMPTADIDNALQQNVNANGAELVNAIAPNNQHVGTAAPSPATAVNHYNVPPRLLNETRANVPSLNFFQTSAVPSSFYFPPFRSPPPSTNPALQPPMMPYSGTPLQSYWQPSRQYGLPTLPGTVPIQNPSNSRMPVDGNRQTFNYVQTNVNRTTPADVPGVHATSWVGASVAHESMQVDGPALNRGAQVEAPVPLEPNTQVGTPQASSMTHRDARMNALPAIPVPPPRRTPTEGTKPKSTKKRSKTKKLSPAGPVAKLPPTVINGVTAMDVERTAAPLGGAAQPKKTKKANGKRSSGTVKKNRKPRNISEAKVVYPTLEEMNNIPFMIHKWHRTACDFGAVQVVPPKEWQHPPCRLLDSNTFYTRSQLAPIPPFKGKLEELDEFDPSTEKISLGKFKEYAQRTQELLKFETVKTVFGEPITAEGLETIKRNEVRFFDVLRHGVGEGEQIKLRYGVDVEAEGAYDPEKKCYDEYNFDGDDCLAHPENREMEEEDDIDMDEVLRVRDHKENEDGPPQQRATSKGQVEAQKDDMPPEQEGDCEIQAREERASWKNGGVRMKDDTNGNVAHAKSSPARAEEEIVPTANASNPNNDALAGLPSEPRQFVFRSAPSTKIFTSTPQTQMPAPLIQNQVLQNAAQSRPQNQPRPTGAAPNNALALVIKQQLPSISDNALRNRSSSKPKGSRRLAVLSGGATIGAMPANETVSGEPTDSKEVTATTASPSDIEVTSGTKDVPNTTVVNPSTAGVKANSYPDVVRDEAQEAQEAGNGTQSEYQKPLFEETVLDGSDTPAPMNVLAEEAGKKEVDTSEEVVPQSKSVSSKKSQLDEEVIDEGVGFDSVTNPDGQSSPVQALVDGSSPNKILAVSSSAVTQAVRSAVKAESVQSTVKSRRKRPRAVNPVSHVGNVNDHGVLRHSPASPGINRPMFYVGASGTKFCFHTEDMFLNSISYMHDGSSVKVWYVIPSDQAELVEEYAEKKIFQRALLATDSSNALLAAKTTMLDPFDMSKYGITVYRVCQTPGTFVITAPQGYHGGWNNGFNVAEAVNFANPDWLVFGRKATDLYSSEKREPVVPYEYIVFHEAKGLCKRMDELGLEKLWEDPTVKIFAKLVAKELKYYTVELEKSCRKYAIEAGIRFASIHDLEQRFALPSLHPSFGNGAGLICSVCRYKAHFFASTCATCEDKLKARCVEHLRVGRICSKKGHKMVITRRHPPLMLLDMLEKVERIAGEEASSEEYLARYRNITENWRLPKPPVTDPRLKCTLKLSRAIIPPEAHLVQPPLVKDMLRKKKEKAKAKAKARAKKRKTEDTDEDEDFRLPISTNKGGQRRLRRRTKEE